MSDQEFRDHLINIRHRLDSIEKDIRALTEIASGLRGEERAAKRNFKPRRKSPPGSGQNKAPAAPKFKRARNYPKT